MIKYLKIKRRAKTRKKCGTQKTEIIYMEKDNKMGKVLKEQSISVQKPILICGKAASGKTKWIIRLVADAPQIWTKIKAPVLLMEANETIAEWRDTKQIKDWWQKDNPEKEWKKLANHDKNKVLLDYVSQNWTIVFVDNIDRMAGRKLDIVKNILMQSKSKVWVCSTTAENRISPSLRNFITKSAPQTFTLNSPVSYDATNAITAVACIAFIVVGWYQVAMILAGLKIMGKGMFSTKQQ
jgi:hypothetical protein